MPNAVLAPVIGSTEAVTKALLGVRNQFDPEAKRSSDRKYKKTKEPAPTETTEPAATADHQGEQGE